MVIKVYVSGISASPEIRSYQQRSTFILDSLRIDYESIDITDVGNEELKDMIKEKCKHRNDQPPKTPQFFNDDVYCGDWFDFEIASDEDRVLTWLGLDDTRYDDLPVDDIPVKEIEGNENNENNEEKSIRTEIKDGILTTETITKEETIVFSKQNVKTAPVSVRLDDSGKEIIQFKNENGETEEENVFLENENNLQIIRGEEEIISSTRTQETNKNTEEDENQENDLDEKENLKNDDLDKKENLENDLDEKENLENDLDEKENLKNDDIDENGNLDDQDLNDSGVNEENNEEINENNDEQDEIKNESDEENSAIE